MRPPCGWPITKVKSKRASMAKFDDSKWQRWNCFTQHDRTYLHCKGSSFATRLDDLTSSATVYGTPFVYNLPCDTVMRQNTHNNRRSLAGLAGTRASLSRIFYVLFLVFITAENVSTFPQKKVNHKEKKLRKGRAFEFCRSFSSLWKLLRKRWRDKHQSTHP